VSSSSSSKALFGVIAFAVLFETFFLHFIVSQHHPRIAWVVTLSSLSLLPLIWSRVRNR